MSEHEKNTSVVSNSGGESEEDRKPFAPDRPEEERSTGNLRGKRKHDQYSDDPPAPFSLGYLLHSAGSTSERQTSRSNDDDKSAKRFRSWKPRVPGAVRLQTYFQYETDEHKRKFGVCKLCRQFSNKEVRIAMAGSNTKGVNRHLLVVHPSEYYRVHPDKLPAQAQQQMEGSDYTHYLYQPVARPSTSIVAPMLETVTDTKDIPIVQTPELSNPALSVSSTPPRMCNPPSPEPTPQNDHMQENYSSMPTPNSDYWIRKTEMEEKEHMARMELLKKEMRNRDLEMRERELDIERKQIELEIKYTELLLLQKKLKE